MFQECMPVTMPRGGVNQTEVSSHSSGSTITIEKSGYKVITASLYEYVSSVAYISVLHDDVVERYVNGTHTTQSLPYTVGSLTYQKTTDGYSYIDTATGRTVYLVFTYGDK